MSELSALSSKFVDALRGDDEITIGQLRAVVGTDLGSSMATMTMGEFLGLQGSAKPVAKPAKAGKAPKAERNGDGEEVDTRTQEGREAYDAKVLAFVRAHGKGDGVPSSAIREACGGTSLQARTALNRLIEAGEVDYTGQARATRYLPAG